MKVAQHHDDLAEILYWCIISHLLCASYLINAGLNAAGGPPANSYAVKPMVLGEMVQ